MLSEKVSGLLERNGIDLNGKRLLCCVSGGADSMALLHFFLTNAETFGLASVCACHMNHGLRGAESDADEQTVRDFCAGNGIDLEVKKLGREELPEGSASEDDLRRLRYEFFERAMEVTSSDMAATAHTLNDNAETVIFRLARGTGLKGMSGIPVARGSFLRPLLDCSREDTEGYCRENGVPFRNDSSNDTDDYSRNVIRHHVLPVLNKLNGRSLEAIDGFAYLSLQADRYFEDEAAAVIAAGGQENAVSRETLLEARPPLDSYIIRRLISGYCPDADSRTVDRCLDAVIRDSRTEITTGVYFSCTGGVCRCEKEYVPKQFGPVPLDAFKAEGRCVSFSMEDAELTEGSLKALFPYCVDYDKLTGVASVRNRRDGDRFSSAYRGVTKTLKKVFNEKHYTPEERDRILILTDDDGIIWVEGEGPAEGKQISPETKKVLRFHTL